MKKVCVGVDIGGTAVKFGIFSEEGRLEDKWEIPTRREESGRYILEDVAGTINEKLQHKGISKEQVIGIGLGVPGPVTKEGQVLQCPNLGWGVFNVVDAVREALGIENVKVANDANVAALGEMWQGGGRGAENLLMITLGTGVGGGVILGGEILSGSRGAAGEIGHITVEYHEKDACACGKHGCLEQFSSATGIVKEAQRKLLNTDKSSILRENSRLTAKAIFDAAKEEDELAMELVEQLGRYLGIACSHVAAVVDPEVFVIGGGVSKAGTILIDVVKKYYEENVMFALRNKEFKLAQLGNDAGIYGSARMVLK